jgi:hypothetical protein
VKTKVKLAAAGTVAVAAAINQAGRIGYRNGYESGYIDGYVEGILWGKALGRSIERFADIARLRGGDTLIHTGAPATSTQVPRKGERGEEGKLPQPRPVVDAPQA